MSILEPAARTHAEDDVRAVREAFYRSCPHCGGSGQVLDPVASARSGQPEPMQCDRCGYLNAGLTPTQDGEEHVARAILDAVAPAIEARALREAADGIDALHPDEAPKNSAIWLRARADQIEAGR